MYLQVVIATEHKENDTIMKMDPELHEAIMNATKSDAAKIIEYLEAEKRKSRVKNIVMFVSTVIAAIASVAVFILQIL